MKKMLARSPELAGLAIGVLDALPRLLAASMYAPGKASLHGWLLLGNVHHVNGPKGLGLDTMQWFGIGAVVLIAYLVAVHITAYLMRPVNGWFLVARGALGAVGGVLLLNVVESLATNKVTDYIGWANGTRFTAINFGDVVLMLALLTFAATFAIGIIVRVLQAPARA